MNRRVTVRHIRDGVVVREYELSPEEVAKMPQPVSFLTTGEMTRFQYQRLWGMLHLCALRGQLTPEWMERFVGLLPSNCACRPNWLRYLDASPPPYGAEADEQFAWSVEAHNAVNRRKGVPETELETARAIWLQRVSSDAARNQGNESHG